MARPKKNKEKEEKQQFTQEQKSTEDIKNSENSNNFEIITITVKDLASKLKIFRKKVDVFNEIKSNGNILIYESELLVIVPKDYYKGKIEGVKVIGLLNYKVIADVDDNDNVILDPRAGTGKVTISINQKLELIIRK